MYYTLECDNVHDSAIATAESSRTCYEIPINKFRPVFLTQTNCVYNFISRIITNLATHLMYHSPKSLHSCSDRHSLSCMRGSLLKPATCPSTQTSCIVRGRPRLLSRYILQPTQDFSSCCKDTCSRPDSGQTKMAGRQAGRQAGEWRSDR